MRGLRQQTGNQLIGQLLKGLMDGHFQIGEAAGFFRQLTEPGLLLRTQLRRQAVDELARRRHLGTSLGLTADFHDLPFRVEEGSGAPIGYEMAAEGHHFLGMDPTSLC